MAEHEDLSDATRCEASRASFELEAVAPSAALGGIGLGVYGLRLVPLTGRDAERAAHWSRLADGLEARRTDEARVPTPPDRTRTHDASWAARVGNPKRGSGPRSGHGGVLERGQREPSATSSTGVAP